MARKKNIEKEQTIPEAQEESGYEVKEWGGVPLYVCKTCSFDTFQLVEMQVHVKKHKTSDVPNVPVNDSQEQVEEGYEVDLKEIVVDEKEINQEKEIDDGETIIDGD